MKNEKQIKIDGYKCIKLDEWKTEWKAEKVKYVIGKAEENEEFPTFYAKVQRVNDNDDLIFALKNKTSGANDVLCLSEEDAKKHILKQNLLMEFRNKRFYENDCNLDQLLLMKAGYHYDPTGPMAEHWQKILEYEKDNY